MVVNLEKILSLLLASISSSVRWEHYYPSLDEGLNEKVGAGMKGAHTCGSNQIPSPWKILV